MSICDTFDELMLQHDVCSISFSKVLTWIKESIECLWKAWRNKHIDWGPNPNPNPRKERDKIQHILESLIRTAEQYQFVMAATTTYRLHMGHISTC
jgi:hypothetical protein